MNRRGCLRCGMGSGLCFGFLTRWAFIQNGLTGVLMIPTPAGKAGDCGLPSAPAHLSTWRAAKAPPARFSSFKYGPIRSRDKKLMPVSDRQLILVVRMRSEEHTSELQSRENLVCRLLLE